MDREEFVEAVRELLESKEDPFGISSLLVEMQFTAPIPTKKEAELMY